MINKISAVNGVQTIAPAFKSQAETKNVTDPTTELDMKGLEALAAYNKSYTEKLSVKPSALILSEDVNAKEVAGEKIYTSAGKLHSIIDETADSKTIYKFNLENEDLAKIEVFNNKTGKLEKEQFEYEAIVEYDPKTGKQVKSTNYNDGAPVYVSQITYQNGKEFEVSHELEVNEYSMYASSSRNNDFSAARFNKNKQLQSVSVTKERNGVTEDIRANFYNGSIFTVTKTTSKVMPNTMGREAMNLENLEPHEKFELPKEDLRALQGEKAYYSNGFVESNYVTVGKGDNTKEMMCYFSPQGALERVIDDNKEITLKPDGSQTIREYLEDGVEKKTFITPNHCSVELNSEDTTRKIWYDDKGNILSYNDSSVSLEFDKKGMLSYAYKKD